MGSDGCQVLRGFTGAATEYPSAGKGWLSQKITNPSLKPLVKKMEGDLKSEKLTGAMLIKEFLT